MKLVSWNVNGLRACVNKGFMDYYQQSEADIFCLQETKLQAGQIEMDLGEDVYQYWNYAIKKGYSGTAVFSRIKPLSVYYGMEEDSEPEGRMITLEYDAFYLINVYTPNAKRDLTRLPYRLEWEDRFRSYVLQLEQTKPVIICGDLNVAHQEIDLKNPKPNMGNSGFTDEERGKMTDLLASGYVDSFRHLHPDQTNVYSWWSYMPKVRERNVGWRIDYFLVSNQLAPSVAEAYIDCHVMGSDHCPVGVKLKL
ncbi:exodeoxyribonuclease III [Paenibacillus cucumis (ex Kampfer et al. 2016)]|uniref:Exodeoxyribonuclease III n=1 Tax=Paenibacillus cucumis (ex Kampfer et al. 2016) TaxID=1776858 RepID=A0ABS7KP33_9BACL|nr:MULTISPECIES: exodeoxyribonuclease III [Paenibacillus]MBY0205880.1 exodeoxyribonuclease III [Paenibacillus cucumis (ex Kampfer et al. 2016)]